MKLPWWSLPIAFALGWLLFHRTPPILPPRITTQYDTVRVIDTAWVTRLKHDTVWKVNIVERVSHTKPETVLVVPSTVGVSAVAVGQRVGDSTLVLGFRVTPDSGRYLLSRWQYQYWTPGPLKSLTLAPTGTPAVDFYPPPPTCDLRCRVKWSAGSVLAAELIRTLLGHP